MFVQETGTIYHRSDPPSVTQTHRSRITSRAISWSLIFKKLIDYVLIINLFILSTTFRLVPSHSAGTLDDSAQGKVLLHRWNRPAVVAGADPFPLPQLAALRRTISLFSPVSILQTEIFRNFQLSALMECRAAIFPSYVRKSTNQTAILFSVHKIMTIKNLAMVWWLKRLAKTILVVFNYWSYKNVI